MKFYRLTLQIHWHGMYSIIKYFPFRVKKLSPFLVCSYVPTKWLKILDPQFVDFKLMASSRTRLYLDIGLSKVHPQYLLASFVESYATKLNFVAPSIITTIRFVAQAQQFSRAKFFFN